MAAKLCIGLSKKVGLPDFGSLGASCAVEFEIDGTLLLQDLDGFHRHARAAFIACQQAVNDQLSQQQLAAGGQQNGPPTNGYRNGTTNHSNGSNGSRQPSRNGNGHRRTTGRPATTSQARAIYAIANRQQIDLSAFLQQRFGIPQPEQLTMSDASSLIDELNHAGTPSNAGSQP